MLGLFIQSFVMGFTAAALPGVVQTTLLQSSVLGKVKSSIKFALGAAFMDGLFLLLAYVGITEFINNFVWFKIVVTLIGAVYISFLGITSLLSVFRNSNNKIISKLTVKNGVLLVLLHPPTIFYFVGTASVLSLFNVGAIEMIISSLILFMGALVCFLFVILLGKIINYTKKDWLIKLVHIIISFILLFFAFKLLLTIL